MQTATKVLERIQNDHENIKNDEPQRFPEAATVGDSVRQGDVYITLLESVPRGAKAIQKPLLQLAPGTTQGSRHCLDSLDGVTLYEIAEATVLDGPVLEATEEKTVTHPEHGDWILPPGCYSITYQRAYADELRRVAD